MRNAPNTVFLAGLMTVLMSLGTTPLWGQLAPLEAQNSVNATGNAYTPNSNIMRRIDNRFKGVLGSPYLLPDWKRGKIVGINGSEFNDVMLRFDIVDGEIKLAQTTGAEANLPREEIAEFSIYDRDYRYRFIAIEDPREEDGGRIFCQVLEEGPVQLLVYRSKYFLSSTGRVAFNNQENAEYKYNRDVYFVRKRESGDIYKVRRINRPLYRFLDEYTDELKVFCQRREFFASEPEELLQIIQFYNRLLRNHG